MRERESALPVATNDTKDLCTGRWGLEESETPPAAYILVYSSSVQRAPELLCNHQHTHCTRVLCCCEWKEVGAHILIHIRAVQSNRTERAESALCLARFLRLTCRVVSGLTKLHHTPSAKPPAAALVIPSHVYTYV